MLSKTLILVILILTTACAPMTSSFYRPDALGGKVVTGVCPPVESTILIETDGITISVRASDSRTDKIGIYIGFEVPEGIAVTLESHKAASIDKDKIFDQHELSGHIWISRGHIGDYDSSTPMIGKYEDRFLWPRGPGNTDNAYYWFSSVLSVPEKEFFVIKLPNILANNRSVQLPIIKFTKDQKTYIGSLNC